MKYCFLILVAMVFTSCSLKTQANMYDAEIQKERILKATKNYEALIQEYRQKVEEKNQDSDRIELANLYFESRDFNNANYYIDPVYKKGNSTQALLLKARILEADNKFQDSLNVLENSLKINPKNADVWNLKGIIFAKNGYYKEARDSFDSARELFLNDFKINTNLGVLEILQGNYLASLTYLKPLYARGYKDKRMLSALVYSLIKTKDYPLAKKIVLKEGLAKDFRSIKEVVLRSKVAKI